MTLTPYDPRAHRVWPHIFRAVVPELRETDAKKGYAYLGGVQKGPRNLLFAKVCPLAGGDWRIGLGVLDCRGFKWP